MKFYYQNYFWGYKGTFEEEDLVKAIYSAWNIEATLYIVTEDNPREYEFIFVPYEDNEFNSELLEPFGYEMVTIGKYREIIDIKTKEVKRYEWSEVIKLNE